MWHNERVTPHADCWVTAKRSYVHDKYYVAYERVIPHADCWVRDNLHSQTIDSRGLEGEHKYITWQYERMTSHLHGWVIENLHSQTLERS